MKKIIPIFGFLAFFSTTLLGTHGPRLQFIHNSPAESVASVDIWIGYANSSSVFPPSKLLEGLNYKEATRYITFSLIYGDLVFYITPAGSVDTSGVFLKKSFGQPEIDYEETFYIVVTGDDPFNLEMVLNDGLENANVRSTTSVSIFHGSPRTPPIDVEEILVPAGLLANDISFGEATPYSTLSSLNSKLVIATITNSQIGEFVVPLSSFADSAIIILASGYLDTTGVTPNNPFKLLLVTPKGNVYEIHNPNATSIEENILQDGVRVFPNPAQDYIELNFNLLEASDIDIQLYDLGGKMVQSTSYNSLQPAYQELRLELKALSDGLYFIHINAGTSVIQRRIRIQN
jgi:hypothetical protein